MHAPIQARTHAVKQAYTAAMSSTLQPCFTLFLVVCRRGLLINNAVVTKAASDTTAASVCMASQNSGILVHMRGLA